MKKEKNLKDDSSSKMSEKEKEKNEKVKATKENPPKGKEKPSDKPLDKTKEKAKVESSVKKTDEIDAIFSMGKKSTKLADGKKDGSKRDSSEAENEEQVTNKKAKIEGNKDDIFGEETKKGRKKTEEGFNIYTEDELGLGRSGGETPLCPFDCKCCF